MSKLYSYFLLAICLVGTNWLNSMEKIENSSMTPEQATDLLHRSLREVDQIKIAFANRANPNVLWATTNRPLLLHIIDTSIYTHEDEKNLPEIVKEFVNQPTLKQETRDKALLIAAESGFTETVRALINGGANVETRHDSDWEMDKDRTALHLASKGGFLDTIKVLVQEGGANIYAQTKTGSTPIMRSANREIREYFEEQQRIQQLALRKMKHLGRSLQKPMMTAAAFLLLVFILYLNIEKA